MHEVPAGAAKSGNPEARNAEDVELPDDLGQVGQDQNQCGGEKNESRLTYFRVLEHG